MPGTLYIEILVSDDVVGHSRTSLFLLHELEQGVVCFDDVSAEWVSTREDRSRRSIRRVNQRSTIGRHSVRQDVCRMIREPGQCQVLGIEGIDLLEFAIKSSKKEERFVVRHPSNPLDGRPNRRGGD